MERVRSELLQLDVGSVDSADSRVDAGDVLLQWSDLSEPSGYVVFGTAVSRSKQPSLSAPLEKATLMETRKE